MIKLGQEVERLTYGQLERLFLEKHPNGMIVSEGYGSVEICFNENKTTKKATNQAGEVVGYYRESRPKWYTYRGSYKVIGTRLGLVKDACIEEAKRDKKKEEERLNKMTKKQIEQEKIKEEMDFFGLNEEEAKRHLNL